MKLQELFEAWSVDATINRDRAGDESLNISNLHAKYMKILSSERLTYRVLLERKKQLASTLEDYYEGRIDGKEINRPPFQYVVGNKGRTQRLVDCDDDIIKANLRIIETEEKFLFLKEVIVSINQRSYNIKNHIEFLKWTNGGSL